MIELSPKLLESSIRYGSNIASWANKVETRYKEFFNLMSKVQQAHGMLNNNELNKSVTGSLASPTISVQVKNQQHKEPNESLHASSMDSLVSQTTQSSTFENSSAALTNVTLFSTEYFI